MRNHQGTGIMGERVTDYLAQGQFDSVCLAARLADGHQSICRTKMRDNGMFVIMVKEQRREKVSIISIIPERR